MRVVHLYPFEPRGRHGGTLRLAAAVDASAAIGEPEVHWFDPGAGAWRGPVDRSALGRSLEPPESRPETGSSSDRPRPDTEASAPQAGLRPSLKRRLFPSTLWESGLRARRAIPGHAGLLAIDSATVVYLHTTYLAGLLGELAAGARASVVDVYDLVWRAHQNDARSAAPLTAALRGAYSRTVRLREEALLRRADAVFVAGYEDGALLARRVPGARWVPTPTPVESVVADPSPDGRLRVGMLGNFAHISTRRSAERILRSPLAADPRVRVLFAGLHAGEAIAGRSGVEVIGPVRRAEDFYSRIDCLVAPVELGSGIKCKLGEALLAARPVVTTSLGAAGFPPSIRAHFTICDPRHLGPEVVRRAVAGFDPTAAREDAELELGRDAVLGRYAAGLGDAARATRGSRGDRTRASARRG